MHLMYFTEQPMSAYSAEEGRDFGPPALMFSNRHFDPVAGSRLYNEYLEHYRLAEEVGFDGIMLNEHHNAPFCMQAKCNVFASILAAMTRRVKLVLLGNPLPLADNPVRLAEELAMIDMVSRGRLVSGFVRGGGQEQLAAGVNPAYNRERFEEAHALIVKAWTQTGPFRWEGTHYQHRVVEPVGLFLALVPHGLRRIRGRAALQPARGRLRGPDHEPADRGGHAEDGDPEAAAAARGDAAVDHGVLGVRRIRLQRGHEDVHPSPRPGSAARAARHRQGARPLEPVRGQRAHQHPLRGARAPQRRRASGVIEPGPGSPRAR